MSDTNRHNRQPQSYFLPVSHLAGFRQNYSSETGRVELTSRSRYDDSLAPSSQEEELRGGGSDIFSGLFHSRVTERGSQEIRPPSISSVFDEAEELPIENYLQDQTRQRNSSHLSRFHHQNHAQQRPSNITQSSSVVATPDRETVQLFDISHQSLWNSYPGHELCGPSAPSMTTSVCSSSSMFASTAGSVVFGSEEVSCCGDVKAAFDQLGRFFNNRSLSDVTLKVGPRNFKAHRLVIVNSSDVFERMFCSRDWRDDTKLEVELHEEPECEKVFGSFLKFLYCRSVALNLDNTLPLLALADKYNVEDFRQVCLKFTLNQILAKIQLKEVFHLWFQYGVRNGHQILIKACVNLLAEKAEELMFSLEWESEWLGMDREQLVEIIKSSELVVKDERDVWLAVQTWVIKNNPTVKNGCGVGESSSEKQLKNFSGEVNGSNSGGGVATTGGISRSRSFNYNGDNLQSRSEEKKEEEDLLAILPHVRFAMMSASQLCEIEGHPLAERHPELFLRFINSAYKYISLPLTVRSSMQEFNGPSYLLRNYLDLRWDKRLVISNYSSYGDRSEVSLRFSTLACTVPAQSWEWELKIYPRGSNSSLSYTSASASTPGECRMILSSNLILDQHPRPLEFQLGIVIAGPQTKLQKEVVLVSGRKNFCRGRFSAESTELDQRLSLSELAEQIGGRNSSSIDDVGATGCETSGSSGEGSPFLIDGCLILQVTFKPIND